jgi:GDP-4-dehydro-6-deoxy-D-mannose reductase
VIEMALPVSETWLITGSTGFLGRNLIESLKSDSTIQPVCVGRKPGNGISDFEKGLARGDFNDTSFWKKLIQQTKPRVILNLAGATPPCNAEELWIANYHWIPGLIAVVSESPEPIKIVHAGSAAELGDVPITDLPVSEGYDAKPLNEYGKSKLAATQAFLNAELKLKPVVARLFNLCGPGQGTRQAWGRYAHELYLRRNENEITLKCFGLEARRDFIDIRDASSAIIELARCDETSRIYHVGCGRSMSIGEGLNLLVTASELNVEIEIDHERSVLSGPQDSIADNRRILRETSWAPKISIQKSLSDLWRSLT